MGRSTGVAPGYLHGFDPREQDRLYGQARFLEPSVFAGVDFSRQRHVLEVGCGVGAQTEILLRRFPRLTVHGIDSSEDQVLRARAHLARQIQKGRARIEVGDALHLAYPKGTFDGAFICWFLEHVQHPVKILREVRRVLRKGAIVHLNEVLNATFYVHPYSPGTLQYWFAYNDYQWTMKGDPFVGGKLANYLLAAGYNSVSTELGVHHYDNRSPRQRAQFIEYWTALLLSGAPGLLEAGQVTPRLVARVRRELRRLKSDPDAVFFYSHIRARARA